MTAQTYIEKEITLFIITRTENVHLWGKVQPVLPLGRITFSCYKYGRMVKGVLGILLYQKSN